MKTRADLIANIDTIVSSFHTHYCGTPEQSKIARQAMDFSLMSLIGNPLLKPVLGSKVFESEYMEKQSELYLLSVEDAASMTDERKRVHLENVNNVASKLKRVVHIKSGSFRLWARK